MKRRMRQGIAILMAALTVLTVMPAQNLYAAEGEATGVTVEAVVENEETAESTEVEEPDTYELNYLMVESPYLETPATQNVVVSVGDENISIAEATLYYTNRDTGVEYQQAAGVIAGDALLFSISFGDANQTGIYELNRISYTANGTQNEIDLSMLENTAIFGVNEEVEAIPDELIVTEGTEAFADIETNVVTTDEEGQVLSGQDIEKVLSGTGAADGATYFSGAADGNLVVILDPGHDNTHGGTNHNGCPEQELVLKIAKYCKAELEQYAGVTVYLTRESNTCPNGGSSVTSTDCNAKRVALAVSKQADVYVSFHLNANNNTSADGAGVYYPNSNYRPDLGQEGKELAQKIFDNLHALGLDKWAGGILIENSKDNTLYPDGSLADYLGVIRRCKEAGIPAVLIEHAFVTNTGDVNNFLNSDAKLQKLGVADANAIVKQYGLSLKGPETPTAIYNGVDYSAVYNYDYYIAHNPDIKAAFGDDKYATLRHFVECGMKEGRQACATFNVHSYRCQYEDLRRAFGNDLKSYYIHYFNWGKNEGRKGTGCTTLQNPVKVYNGTDYSAVYDYNYYIAKYPEVKKIYGLDDFGVLKYFVETGMKSGHQGKASFDVRSYRNQYEDLRRAFGNDLPAYYRHYISWGKNEGRKGTGCTTLQNPTKVYKGIDYSAVYDYNYYITKYPDVKTTYGVDDAAVLKYFVEKGMPLCQQGSANFDVQSYRNQFVDLRRAFGNNLPAYYKHYMEWGRQEGRPGTGCTTMQNPTTVYAGVDYKDVYDFNYYINHHGDIKNAFGNDENAVLAHFVNFGMKEGRQAKDSFNVQVYKNNYADLQQAFGNNLKSYYLHYMDCGKKEGRNATAQIYTSIMGTSNTNVAQMAAYFRANATYPSFYATDADPEANTLEEFCQIYLEECAAEGVRAEVAFAQMRQETGFLSYRGDVLISQYNFAGIDASGKHYKPDGSLDYVDRGRSYGSVREGIRAHVQRLKAYAVKGTNPSSFKNTCVDPDKFDSQWWTSTIVGCSPYVDWLGKQENPSGFGWATDPGYGGKLKKHMASLAQY